MKKFKNSIRCPLCGNKKIKMVSDLAYYFSKPSSQKFFWCQKCSLGWVSLSNNSQRIVYDSEYYHRYEDFLKNTDSFLKKEKVFKKRVDYIFNIFGSCRILDIGCATGHFLDIARNKGLKTYGIDISKYAVNIAQQKDHIVLISSASLLPFPNGFFQCVHLNHVLEHLEKPVQTLREIKRVLSKPGLLIIEIPNEVGILSFRIKRLLGRTRPKGSIFGKSISQEYVPHIFYFTKKSLTKMLVKCGFYNFYFKTRPYGLNRNIKDIKSLIADILKRTEIYMKNSDLLEVYIFHE